jgi:hypothetical protein
MLRPLTLAGTPAVFTELDGLINPPKPVEPQVVIVESRPEAVQ